MQNTASLLVPGKNCWRVEKAEKAAFLVDGDSYYHAFREAVKRARHTVFINSWDIDSRLELLREDPDDGYPIRLRDFLDAIAGQENGPRIYILNWDFAMLIGMEREWFPIYKLDWKTHKNVRLAMDDLHPVGASHHQKIVVIDDSLAFVGGLDLTKTRWDTPLHDPDDQKRKNPNGEPYRPHHDVQLMVVGKPAAALGDFFRQRWKRVSKKKIPDRPEEPPGDVWPDDFKPDIGNCRVGIARTRAKYKEEAEVREVEKLYLDTISRARKYIYIENQYLTASKISKALAESLRSKEGPEIIIVLPLSTDGWLSQYTMDILRKRAVCEMQQANAHNRLGVFYAHQEGLLDADSIKVHAKLMIADDTLVRIGSANLNNRSMGLDTEVDLVLEADDDPEQRKAMAGFCNRLLAEHLGVEPEDVEQTLTETGSRLEAIRRLQGNKRTLKKLEFELDDTVELVAEEQYLLDPEEPIEPERLIERWLPLKKLKAGSFNKIGLAALFLVAVGLALAWRFTPLHDMISGEQLLRLVDFLKDSKLAWLYVAVAYIFGSILLAPITVLITLTILIYGSYMGVVLAILGAGASGTITYWLGRIMGRNTVRRLAGNKVNQLSRQLGKSGIFSSFIVHLMPIAPYSIVNIIAGATHISFFDFILGTILGLLPGILAIAGLIDRGAAVFTDPNPMTVLALTVVVAVIGVGYFFLQRKMHEEK